MASIDDPISSPVQRLLRRSRSHRGRGNAQGATGGGHQPERDESVSRYCRRLPAHVHVASELAKSASDFVCRATRRNRRGSDSCSQQATSGAPSRSSVRGRRISPSKPDQRNVRGVELTGRLRKCGESLRRRGNPGRTLVRIVPTGPIPAQAGEPCQSRSRRPHRRAYPRAGGGPRDMTQGMDASRAYPRAGGGTMKSRPIYTVIQGLSPRRRGNQGGELLSVGGEGPIPAQAGEPRADKWRFERHWAYPRAGGGTTPSCSNTVACSGLSPRRRGNPCLARFTNLRFGPIPAQAGEPARPSAARSVSWAYPRAGGGTVHPAIRALHDAGLSPRRRGNHLR